MGSAIKQRAVFFLGVGVLLLASGCSKHKCDLPSDTDKAQFGVFAEATGGAHSCFLSNSELVATHADSTVDGVAQKYQAFLQGKGFAVSVEEYSSQRANGKPLVGKKITSVKDGKTWTTVVYILTGAIVETATTAS